MPLYLPVSAGGAAVPPPAFFAPAVTARWYRPATNQNGASASQTLNLMYGRPLPLGTGTIDRIGAYVGGTVTASEVCRLGIYTNGSNNRPDALVVDGGTIDLSASGNVAKAVTVSTAISNGIYWLVAVRQGPTVTCQMGVFSGTSEGINWGGLYSELISGDPPTPWNNTNTYMSYVTVAGVTGALPGTFGTPTAVGATQACPFVFVRYT